jgi:hypothetical protein
MKRVTAIILLSLFCKYVTAQTDTEKGYNIYRVGIDAPILNAKFSVERGISEAFSLNGTITIATAYFDRGGGIANCMNIAATFDGELRYYFTMAKRINRERNYENYSGTYFSLQPYLRTQPFAYKYESDQEEFPAFIGLYANIGLQRQLKKGFYFNAYAGICGLSQTLSPSRSGSNPYPAHIGITFGYAINTKIFSHKWP